MAKHFGVAEDVSYTCETAAHFWLLHVLARWEKFLATVQQKKTPECVKVSPAFGYSSFSSLCGRRPSCVFLSNIYVHMVLVAPEIHTRPTHSSRPYI